MKEFTYVIKDEQGIHARPAGELVKKIKEFSSKITVEKNGKEVKAQSIFALMSLGVKKGEEIIVRVDGEDEENAAAALLGFLNENL